MKNETLHSGRHIPLESVQNLRDLGGYSTIDGNTTQWRRYLRSAGLADLTPLDRQKMLDYGIGTVVDLRSQQNIEESPNPFAELDGITYHHHDLWGGRMADFKSSTSSLTQEEKMADLYRLGFSRCEGIIGEILGTLAEERDHATLFHCGAGKDRTGMIAALLLGIAGVSHATIAADYGLTDLYLTDPMRDHGNPDPMYIPDEPNVVRGPNGEAFPVYMFSCLPATMHLALAYLDENYGGIEEYVRKTGLTNAQIERLRSSFLQ
jgi:protein-tyrosine phosphatase